jgi:hypothetical protein
MGRREASKEVAQLLHELNQLAGDTNDAQDEAAFENRVKGVAACWELVEKHLVAVEAVNTNLREEMAVFLEDSANTLDPAGVRRHLLQRAALLRGRTKKET